MFLIALSGRTIDAFPTRPHQPLKLGGCQQSINQHKSINFNGYYKTAGLPHNGSNSARVAAASSLRAKPTQADELEEFQRSLLEAKLANDKKDTHVKEEKQRNEIVEKQIGQEKEYLQDAVKEVKEAVQNITSSAKSLGGAVITAPTEVKEAAKGVSKSAKNLGGAFIKKGPGIFGRLFTVSFATSEIR